MEKMCILDSKLSEKSISLTLKLILNPKRRVEYISFTMIFILIEVYPFSKRKYFTHETLRCLIYNFVKILCLMLNQGLEMPEGQNNIKFV